MRTCKVCFATALIALCLAAPARAQTIISSGTGNGSFESGDTANSFLVSNGYLYLTTADSTATSVAGWTITEGNTGTDGSSNTGHFRTYWNTSTHNASLVANGSYSVNLVSGDTLATTFSASAGYSYQLTVQLKDNSAGGSVVFQVGGNTVGTSSGSLSSGTFQTLTYDFTTGSSGSTALSFYYVASGGTASGAGLSTDNVNMTVTAVPEPSVTGFLLAVAVFTPALLRRRGLGVRHMSPA